MAENTVNGQKKTKLALIFMGIGIVLYLTIIPAIVMFILSIVNGVKAVKEKANNTAAIVAIVLSSIGIAGELFIDIPIFILALMNYLSLR